MQLLPQTFVHSAKHGVATRKDYVVVKLSSEIVAVVALLNRLVAVLLNTVKLMVCKSGIKQHLSALESFVAESQSASIGQIVLLLTS